MIRRNTASQTIYLPALLLKADGAAVTSGASLQVAKDGTEAASAGTLTHFADGVWKYTPTQAETDAAIVGLILTATNAAPVVLNLVTTAANTAAAAFGANTVTPTNLSAAQVRTELAVELARIDAAISTRLAGASYSAPLDAAGTRTAIGLASANLDTQVGAVATSVGKMPRHTTALADGQFSLGIVGGQTKDFTLGGPTP